MLKLRGRVIAEAYRNGRLLWIDLGHNLVVNAGVDYAHKVAMLAGAQIATWYIGLLAATPLVAATDTMAAHGGWTEIVAYTQVNRVAWLGVATTNGASDNSASPASFSINANGTTVGGIFLTSSNVKAGAVGTLYSGYAFSQGNRVLNNGDTLLIKYAHSSLDDGV